MGRSISERHEHFDAEGNPTGHTVITREPLWDDLSRDAAYADWLVELEKCPMCGGPRDECSDPDRPWYPDDYRCHKAAALAVADRTWDRAHEKVKPDAYGFLPTDGARVLVAREDPTPGLDWPSGLPLPTGG